MPKRLAEIVIDAGLASREAVLDHARLADRERIPLIAALVHHGGLDELALVAAIKRQVRVAIADPALVENDPEAMRELPHEICRRLRVMPLSISSYDTGARVLRLAMADPTDAIALAEVEHVTGCEVECALMPLSAVDELVDEGYRSFITEVIPRERLEPAGRPERARASESGQAPESAGDGARAPEGACVPEGTRAGGAPPADPPVARAAGTGGMPGGAAQPSTVPFHRISDEASLELRHRALLDLLLDKKLVTEQEYEDRIRLLMKQHNGEG